MDTETTTWKKNRLEENKNDLANGEQYDKIEQFQNNVEFPEIIKVNQKIKQIHKKRKRFSKNPILESIYDVNEDHEDPPSDLIVENFETNTKDTTPSSDKKESGKNIKDIKKMIEIAQSLNESISLKKSDFADKELKKEINIIQGFEQEVKKKSKKDRWCKDNKKTKFLTSFRSVILYLKYPIIYIDYILKKLGIFVSIALSQNKATDSEKKIVIERMKEIIFICISLFIVYNWFFIWCFRYEDGKDGEHVITSNINISLFENSEWSILKFFHKIFKYLFEFVISPVALLDYAFTIISPVLLDYIKIVNMKWVLLFIIISSSFTKVGAYLKNLFFQSLQVCFARDIPAKIFGTKSASFATYPFLHTLIAGSYLKSFVENLEMPAFFFIAIFNGISGLIRIVFSHFCVSLAAIFVCIYLFIYSFLAIPIYSKHSISKTMKLIDQFIKDSIVEKPVLKNCDTPDEYKCKNKSWAKYIFELLQNIANVIYSYIFSISIIMVLFQSIIIYALKIENHEFKMALIIITLVMILCIGITNLRSFFGNIFSNKKDKQE
jgi:hypothetical protein